MPQKVSIIIPCYNQGRFLNDSVLSILSQDYGEWECLIINDGSTDNTEDVARDLMARDSRIRYFHKANGGLSSARNWGLDRATGDCIQFLDADDVLAPQKFSLSLSAMNQDTVGPDMVISNFRMFATNPDRSEAPYCSLNSSLFNYEAVLFEWDNSFSIPIHCGFFNATLFAAFRFNETLRAKEDWLMWIQFFKHNQKATFLDIPLAMYRRHGQSMTMSQSMVQDYLAALDILWADLEPLEYHRLSRGVIERYYTSSIFFKTRLAQVSGSRSYRFELTLRKVLSKLGLSRFLS